MQLSILDQSPIRAGRAPADSIRETVELARLADRLGYARYWVSEHHNSPSVAGSAPEILVAAIASVTERIRVGSAGVMLPHYASLKVAETFRVLESLAPGRIDLGVGRAPGSDMLTALALNPNAMQAADRFGVQVQEVIALLAGEALPVGGVPGLPAMPGTIVAQPTGPHAPQLWILGSSNWGAQAAAMLGLPYCFAHFFSDGRGAEEALDLYLSLFRPSVHLAAPRAGIAVYAVAAENEADAWHEYRAREAWVLARNAGRYEPLQDPATISFEGLPSSAMARLEAARAGAAVGTGRAVLEALQRTAARLGAEEVAVVTATFDPKSRCRSYRLLAEAAGLVGAS